MGGVRGYHGVGWDLVVGCGGVIVQPVSAHQLNCRFYLCQCCHQTEIIVNMGPYDG
jgi:hypothetical protein